MMKPTVEIEIAADGSVTVESKNVIGPGCQKLTEEIEKSLGSRTEDVKKPEYHRPVQGMHGQSAGAK